MTRTYILPEWYQKGPRDNRLVLPFRRRPDDWSERAALPTVRHGESPHREVTAEPVVSSARRRTLSAVVAVVAGITAPADAAAQKTGWSSTVEANGNLLFGATSQTLTSLEGDFAHAGERFSADAAVKFRYGESEDEERIKFVSSRSWETILSVDIHPHDRVSPFAFGSAGASLEKRIDHRESGGVGAKWTFAQTNTGKASVSLAALGERTVPLSDTLTQATSLVRWSWRVKFAQRVDDRISFTHVTFYQPAIDAPSRYTVASTSVGSYAINSDVALTLTFTDNYDSEATGRGALANNDGSVLFGIRATF